MAFLTEGPLLGCFPLGAADLQQCVRLSAGTLAAAAGFLGFLVTSLSIRTVGLVLVFVELHGGFAALAPCETDEEFGLCCFRQLEQEELKRGDRREVNLQKQVMSLMDNICFFLWLKNFSLRKNICLSTKESKTATD